MKSKHDIKSFYDDFSSVLKHDLIYKNRRHIKHMIVLDQILKNRKIKSVLEIGTGVGVITEYLSRKVKVIHSIDISSNNIDIARKHLNKNVKLICGNIMDVVLENKYDLILLLDTLEHIPKENHLRLFKKLKSLMHSNSLIVITIPNPDFLQYLKNKKIELQIIDEQIRLDEIWKLCKETGLIVTSYNLFGIDYKNQYIMYKIESKNINFMKLAKSETLHERIIFKELNNHLMVFIRKLIWKYRLNGKL